MVQVLWGGRSGFTPGHSGQSFCPNSTLGVKSLFSLPLSEHISHLKNERDGQREPF